MQRWLRRSKPRKSVERAFNYSIVQQELVNPVEEMDQMVQKQQQEKQKYQKEKQRNQEVERELEKELERERGGTLTTQFSFFTYFSV